MAEGCFDVQKKEKEQVRRDIDAFSPHYYHKWIGFC